MSEEIKENQNAKAKPMKVFEERYSAEIKEIGEQLENIGPCK